MKGWQGKKDYRVFESRGEKFGIEEVLTLSGIGRHCKTCETPLTSPL